MTLKQGDVIVGTQAQHKIRLLVLRALPGGGAKVRGIGPLASHWRKRETYLTKQVLLQYKKERE